MAQAPVLGAALQPWLRETMQSATSLHALCVRTIVALPAGLRFHSLKDLQLLFWTGMPWMSTLMAVLRHCSTLESLKLKGYSHLGADGDFASLPDMQFQKLSNLKHVELLWCYPARRIALPPSCLLRLDASVWDHSPWQYGWENGSRQHLAGLHLVYQNQEEVVHSWPKGLQQFTCLQYLKLDYRALKLASVGDLADLQHISHVQLFFQFDTELRLTAGAWKSLEVKGLCSLSNAFSDVDGFVKTTENFLFSCSTWPHARHGQEAQDFYSQVKAACSRQGLCCYESVCEKETFDLTVG